MQLNDREKVSPLRRVVVLEGEGCTREGGGYTPQPIVDHDVDEAYLSSDSSSSSHLSSNHLSVIKGSGELSFEKNCA